MEPNVLAALFGNMQPAPPVDLGAYLGNSPAPAPAAAPPSGNILATLQGGSPSAVPQPAPTPVPAPARVRSSLLDKLGRVADVLATVGGAHPLYQSTLDARQDRGIALEDHSRQVDLDKLKIALGHQDVTEGNLKNQATENAQVGAAARALQSLGSGVDVAKTWPVLAAQAGIEPGRAAALGELFGQNPDAIGGIASMFGGTNLGKNVQYAVGADGKAFAYQVGPDGQPHILDLGGASPVAPGGAKMNDTGAAIVPTDPLTGLPVGRILPKTVRPDTVANNATSRANSQGNNATAIKVAEIGANSRETVAANKPGKGKDDAPAATSAREALISLGNIRRGFQQLRDMQALPGQGSGLNAAANAVGMSGIGQALGEKFGSQAAQLRVGLEKNAKILQQTLVKALPAGATRTKFEQEILAKSLPDPTRMTYETADQVIREYEDTFRRALAASRKPAPAAPGRQGPAPVIVPKKRIVPRPTKAAQNAGKPSVSNW